MFAPKNIKKTSPATPRGKLHVVKQTYADGSTYEGGYLNFKKHGKGVISFSNGEKYDGHWAEGLKEGSGVYTWADGSCYIGNWHSDRMNGEGTHVSSNGSKYSGSWSDNLMHGSGLYEYDNGSRYKGSWFQGQQHGSGTLVVSEKEMYEGVWHMGLMHGKGTYVWGNGDKYFGDYKDGKKNGFGKLSLASGEEYDGEWLNGLKHGHGIYTCNDLESYKGEWCGDRMHGEGQYFWPDGSFFKGAWIFDSRSGQGFERLADGSQYEGSFVDNTRNGLGTMLYLDGSKYEGNWQHEQWHGHGTFTSADGSAIEGTFIQGVIHGHGTERDANGQLLYEGDWANGIREGKGLLKTPVGEYSGEFLAGKKHGQGTDSFVSGSTYTGQFIENQRHGHGVMSHSNGSVYDGQWKSGERCGQGKYVESNGYAYSGEWEHDLKHGQGFETIDEDNSYQGPFCKGVRHGKGRTTTSKSTQSALQTEESQPGHCIHEGMYVQNKKCGVGTETYPDGSCYYGVWSDGMKHGPGLLKIANDVTYHVIFNEDTIVDIFYSMEAEGENSLSVSTAHGYPDGLKNARHSQPEVTRVNNLQQAEKHSAGTAKNINTSKKGHRTTADSSAGINHVRFDPFQDIQGVNLVNGSSQQLSHINREASQIEPSDILAPFSDFAAEENNDMYDLNETDLCIPAPMGPFSAAKLAQVPSQVTVIVDYGIWGSPSPKDLIHTSRLKSADADLDGVIQSLANSSLPSGILPHTRKMHANRNHASGAKQHRVPRSTSKESAASSSASKIANKIDIFNL